MEQNTQQWNPVEAAKAKYPNMGLSDNQVFQNLSDPQKFRSAFPEYSGLSDADITQNMQKFGAANPQYTRNIDAIRAANDSRPWYKKLLGLPADEQTQQAEIAGQQQNLESGLRDDFQAKADPIIGAGKEAAKHAIAVDNLVRKGLNHVGGHYEQIKTPTALEPNSENQKAGAFAENVLEFMAGDDALQALPMFKRLEALTKTAKILEENPTLAKLAHMGITAARQGVIGGAQGALNGEDAEGVAKDALMTGGLGGVAEGVGNAISGLGPTITKIGGEEIPVLASQEGSKLANAAETVTKTTGKAGESQLGKFAARQQASAQKAVGGVAREVASKAADELNAASVNPLTMSTEEFAKATDTKQLLSHVNSFGDAANELKAAAKTRFSNIDELTDGEFSKLQDERSQILKNMRSGDLPYEKLTELRSQLADVGKREDSLFNKVKLSAEDKAGLEAGRKAWKQATAMDELQARIEGATSGTPNDVQPIKTERGGTITGTPEKINGDALNRRLRTMDDDELMNALGGDKQQRDALFVVAKLLRTGENSAKTGLILRSLRTLGKFGGGSVGAFTHPVLTSVAEAGTEGTSYLLGKVLTNPKAAKVLADGLQSNASVGTISNLLMKVLNDKQTQ